MANKSSSSRFPLVVRILAIALSILVAGSAVTYLIMFFMGLFS